MIIRNEGHIHLKTLISRIQTMVVILNTWHQEITMVLVGTKGHTACTDHHHKVAVMIIMEDNLPLCRAHYPGMVLGLLLLLWGRPLSQITIMDSHMVKSMPIHRTHSQLRNPAMLMVMKNINMMVMHQHHILTADRLPPSQAMHSKVINQVTALSSHTVSHQRMACHHHKDIKHKITVRLVNLEICRTQVIPRLLSTIQMLHLNSNTRMHREGQCNQLIPHTALLHQPMAIVRLQ